MTSNPRAATLARVAEIEARWAKITPAPWKLRTTVIKGDGRAPDQTHAEVYTEPAERWLRGIAFLQGEHKVEDGAAIAHAPDDVAWLCVQLRAALGEEAEATGPCAKCGGQAACWCNQPRIASPAPASGMGDEIAQAAYEQAAKWCEERAAQMLERFKTYGKPDPMDGDWVRGCADTIRFNAAAALSRHNGVEEKP